MPEFNFEERIQRLTERHEALAQAVELIARDLQSLSSLVDQIAEGTARLLHTAQIREERLQRLERKP
jgi:archaellum component FlaC